MEQLEAVAEVKVGLITAVLPGPVAQALLAILHDGRERHLHPLIGWDPAVEIQLEVHLEGSF
jgi:hypothetical protein